MESWRLLFFCKDSLLWWHITNRNGYRRRGNRFIQYLVPGTVFIELRFPSELRSFYRVHELERR